MATFCLLHGNWHDGSCWQPLVESLERRGHRAIAPDLPFDDPATTYADRVRPALDVLEDVSGPIVVVGHSMASGYAPLVAVEHPGSLLVHICPRLAFAAPEGAPAPFRQGFPFPTPSPNGTMTWEPDAAIAAMYMRFPPETARAFADRLHPGAPAADDFPLPGHPDVPTVLIYTADDEIFDPEWERFMARELLGVEPIELPGGHYPMVEDPEGLADLLDGLARKQFD
jgi:pimeloyl-ACP methyl ester carboxylesterase